MLDVSLNLPTSRPPELLCVGAHCDDIEIGCSGAVMRLLEMHPTLHVVWFVLTGNSERQGEAQNSAQRILGDRVNFELIFEDFKDGHLPYQGMSVKEKFELLKTQILPDLIFSHWEGDRHQDHRFVSEMTWSTFRQSLILEYEIPKYDGDLGKPNVFVPLSDSIVQRKVSNIIQSFQSQIGKHWFDTETFTALHRLRGMENLSDFRYAEGFYCRKLCLSP